MRDQRSMQILRESAPVPGRDPLSDAPTNTGLGRFSACTDLAEAELMASRMGGGVVRLRPEWDALLSVLPQLGHICAITSNRAAVIKKNGIYLYHANSSTRSPYSPIDLAVDLASWLSAFVVVDRDDRSGLLTRSIYFYGKDGSAVHTLHLTRTSSVGVFEEIVEEFAGSDRRAEAPPEHTPATMQPLLFPQMDDLRRKPLMPFVPAPWAAEGQHAIHISQTNVHELFRYIAHEQILVTISVVNAGCAQIHCGLFRRIENVQGALQVKDCGTELVFSEESLAHAWVVKGPVADRYSETLELFDAQGREAALITPCRKAGPNVERRWSYALKQFTQQAVAA